MQPETSSLKSFIATRSVCFHTVMEKKGAFWLEAGVPKLRDQ